MDRSLRGRTALVGAATFGTGSAPGWTAFELMEQAAVAAVRDSGMTMGDIDGLCASTFAHFFPTLSAAEHLGLRPRWSNADMVGGSSFMNHIMHAAAAIEAGLCHNVLILYGSVARSTLNVGGLAETPETEQPWEPLVPLSGYALAATRYMHDYGATREDLGRVHLSARAWAALNPEAELRDQITMDDYLAARIIATPFGKLDCCLVSDGAGALVLTGSERARDCPKPPIAVLGVGSAHWHREIAQMPDLTVTAATDSGRRAYAMAGLTPQEIDLLQIYDAFTINVLLFLEDLGFAEKGAAPDLVRSGAIAPGGSLPTNTNGGGLCCVHPGMYGIFAIIEAVRQLRGDADSRQVPDAQTALVHGNGGTLSHQSTVILGGRDTL